MATKQEKTEHYIQVGVTAMRDPATGDFLPAVPLYIKADECTEQEEVKLVEDLGKLLAQRMKRYKDGCRAAGIRL